MSRKKTTRFFVVLALSIAAVPVFAQVNEPEIRSVGSDTVEFVNYNGPHAVINTLDQIKSIGSGLGAVIAPNPAESATAGARNRYYVIHAVDPATTDKLDADILFIGPDASVDHIRNLRHIIAGYLVSAYNYSEADAQTLAVFVTVYNAVYRGNMEVFTSRYKGVVTDNLTAEHAGLSLNYVDWPGRSQIVIPLSSTTGGLGTVDTTVISDSGVIDSMREEDDMGIDDRKDLVDIKEREADQAEELAQEAQQEAATAQQEADRAQQEADRAQQEADRAQQEADRAQQEADRAQQEADRAQQEADENPDDQQAQQQADRAQQEADDAQQQADQAQQEADDAQQQADQAQQEADDAQQQADDARQEAEHQQEIADQKRDDARDDRAEIAKDQQQLLERGGGAAGDGVYGLKHIDSEYSVMVKLDKVNGSELKESPVAVIRGRTLVPADENFMAIAGANTGNGAVKVVLLDTENMEIVGESTERASETSVLVKDGDAYYAVIQEGGNWLVGKYNSKLQLQMKSKIGVHKDTPITLTESGMIVTDPKGVARLLSYDDLSQVSAN